MAKSKSTYSPMNLRLTVYGALFTALFIIGGYIFIPIGPVPIALVDFFVMLAGLFLGWKRGLASVMLYVFLGALGLPVFSAGRAGLAVLVGPSGGFLLGYMLLVLTVGLIAGKGKPSLLRIVIALVVGNILLFAAGAPWFKMVMHLNWEEAMMMGVIPFLPGNIIKTIAVAWLAQVYLSRFRQTMLGVGQQSSNAEDDQ